MTPAALAAALGHAHMRRSNLCDRISILNERLAKALRELGETDIRICDLKDQIKRHAQPGRAAA